MSADGARAEGGDAAHHRPGPPRHTLPRPILDAAASLFPGYFTLVMATGVVSIARQLTGLRPVALALALAAVNRAA